jgi:predicted ABC-type ATPase
LLRITEFVDADVIARGISAFAPEQSAVAAGRIMLSRLKELARKRQSFAFETTLSARWFAPWAAGLKGRGFGFHIIFLWLPSADIAVRRVQDRVSLGGHHVSEDVIRRRYRAGLGNFFQFYRPLATSWRFYDNSVGLEPRLVAAGRGRTTITVTDIALWSKVETEYGAEKERRQNPA